ncbi:acyltransferase family protein [Comamonas sp. GB3 AK4-5]|uniref:acyltransferase family protein n=1 Tax=Comamonas sp. GB3 AK4-5 TaxID=3231487 RepID=UPI00351DFB99
MSSRNTWLDQVKGLACLLIICHHLAFYGPMSDVVKPMATGLMDWLFEYARMAVQVFLVLGGYLAAAGLAPQGLTRHSQLLSLLGKRFVRLVLPFAAALALTMLVTELVRNMGFEHASMSAPPTWSQLLAHLFLLQGVGGWESLSAGVWYVAIDFQLYALTALWIWTCHRLLRAPQAARNGQPLPTGWHRFPLTLVQLGVLVLTLVSLWDWNRDSELDNWAIYFFGTYGLGMMAWWAAHSVHPMGRWWWAAGMMLLGAVALWVEWRTRIALALVTALVLALAGSVRWPARVRSLNCAPLQQLGQMSYSVFLIHFCTSLLVNAVWHMLWPDSVVLNAVGLLLAVLLSVAAGHLLYQGVESRSANWQELLRWQAGTMGVGAAVALNLI